MVHSRIRTDRMRAGCRPSHQQELLLRAALFSGDAALKAWRKWRGLVDPDLHHLDMGSFRLIPLLNRNLKLLGVQDPIMDRFKGIFRRTWYQNQTLFHSCARVLEALQTAGLDILVLDGVPLVLNYYQDLGLRSMDDFDVLVRTGQAEKAIRILTSLGWKLSNIRIEKLSPAYFAAGHALHFNKGPSLSCNLHWGLMPGRPPGPVDKDVFCEAAVPLHIREIRVQALGTTDQLLRVCGRGMSWSWAPQIQWIADAVVILSGEDVRIDWKRLIGQAQRYQVSLRTYSTLFYLRHRMDVAIPDDVFRQLENMPTSDLERRMFAATLRGNKLIGSMEYSWLRYRAYAAERGEPNRLLGALGFFEYLRLTHGHDSRWHALRWAVSRGVYGMRMGRFRSMFQQKETHSVPAGNRYPWANRES